jgi:hypothetical protein
VPHLPRIGRLDPRGLRLDARLSAPGQFLPWHPVLASEISRQVSMGKQTTNVLTNCPVYRARPRNLFRDRQGAQSDPLALAAALPNCRRVSARGDSDRSCRRWIDDQPLKILQGIRQAGAGHDTAIDCAKKQGMNLPAKIM